MPRGMWDLPGSGIELVTPALVGGLLSTGPPGKSLTAPFLTADACSSAGLDGDSAAAGGETEEDDHQCLYVLGV